MGAEEQLMNPYVGDCVILCIQQGEEMEIEMDEY